MRLSAYFLPTLKDTPTEELIAGVRNAVKHGRRFRDID